MVARAYTPITLDCYDKGYFDLVVKRYSGGEFSERFHRYAAAVTRLLPPTKVLLPTTRLIPPAALVAE